MPLETAGNPIHLNDAELETLLRTSPVPVLVDFYADWCGPCRTLAPVLEQLGRELAGRLTVVKVDTDRDGLLASRLGVQSIPAVHLFAKDRSVASQVGTQPLSFWRRFVAPHVDRGLAA